MTRARRVRLDDLVAELDGRDGIPPGCGAWWDRGCELICAYPARAPTVLKHLLAHWRPQRQEDDLHTLTRALTDTTAPMDARARVEYARAMRIWARRVVHDDPEEGVERLARCIYNRAGSRQGEGAHTLLWWRRLRRGLDPAHRPTLNCLAWNSLVERLLGDGTFVGEATREDLIAFLDELPDGWAQDTDLAQGMLRAWWVACCGENGTWIGEVTGETARAVNALELLLDAGVDLNPPQDTQPHVLNWATQQHVRPQRQEGAVATLLLDRGLVCTLEDLAGMDGDRRAALLDHPTLRRARLDDVARGQGSKARNAIPALL